MNKKIYISKQAAQYLGVTDLMISEEEQTFLKESNAIEGVYDQDSLDQAIYAWAYLRQQEKLTSSVILKTHKILMLHQKLMPDEKGYFRQVPVWVGGREGKPWYVIPEMVENWCKDIEKTITQGIFRSDRRLDDQIKDDHVRFEKIHPFVDGNGRTGRLLYLWQRIKLDLPVLILWADERNDYYQWFRK